MSTWASLLSGSNNKQFEKQEPSKSSAPIKKFTISKGELSDLSLAANRLWDLDANRLTPGKDYVINLQGGTKVYKTEDKAADPLFTRVDANALEKPTFKTFIALLDNYVKETGVSEVVTQEEKNENWAFINAIFNTGPIQYLKEWLAEKGLFKGKTDQDFKKKLHDIWLKLYSREARNDSSGFEHVFVGEVKQGKVTGFHNWIQFYLEEQRGTVDYRGWILPKRKGRVQRPNAAEQLVSIQFAWGKEAKSVSSSFIGVSPEFEIALYTMCFMNGAVDNDLEIEEYEVNIKCYTFKGNLGTSYPIAKCE